MPKSKSSSRRSKKRPLRTVDSGLGSSSTTASDDHVRRGLCENSSAAPAASPSKDAPLSTFPFEHSFRHRGSLPALTDCSPRFSDEQCFSSDVEEQLIRARDYRAESIAVVSPSAKALKRKKSIGARLHSLMRKSGVVLAAASSALFTTSAEKRSLSTPSR